MARRILIAPFALVLVLLLVIASRPSSFRVERSIVIPVPADAVFTQVNDFHTWAGWSPWETLDPAMKKSFSGAPTGTGSVYGWAGTDKVGEGRMTMEKSERPSAISIKLEFVRPFAATNRVGFTFAPAGAGTRVVWSLSGERDFMAKAAGMFMDMDKTVGGDFEKGLAALSNRSQAQARAGSESEGAAKDDRKR